MHKTFWTALLTKKVAHISMKVFVCSFFLYMLHSFNFKYFPLPLFILALSLGSQQKSNNRRAKLGHVASQQTSWKQQQKTSYVKAKISQSLHRFNFIYPGKESTSNKPLYHWGVVCAKHCCGLPHVWPVSSCTTSSVVWTDWPD